MEAQPEAQGPRSSTGALTAESAIRLIQRLVSDYNDGVGIMFDSPAEEVHAVIRDIGTLAGSVEIDAWPDSEESTS